MRLMWWEPGIIGNQLELDFSLVLGLSIFCALSVVLAESSGGTVCQIVFVLPRGAERLDGRLL